MMLEGNQPEKHVGGKIIHDFNCLDISLLVEPAKGLSTYYY